MSKNTKAINISLSNYALLDNMKALKKDKKEFESFNDVITRLIAAVKKE